MAELLFCLQRQIKIVPLISWDKLQIDFNTATNNILWALELITLQCC